MVLSTELHLTESGTAHSSPNRPRVGSTQLLQCLQARGKKETWCTVSISRARIRRLEKTGCAK